MASGYFLEGGKIVEKELEIGKEYYAIEFFDEKGSIIKIDEIGDLEKAINRYTHKGKEVKFLGVVKNKNGDELYNFGEELVDKRYILFE